MTCLHCGNIASVKYVDLRINDTSYWCDFCFDSWVQVTEFSRYLSLKTHKAILERLLQKSLGK